MPMISDKSSIGFHRPRSLFVVCWPVRCFLLFFALLELDSDLAARRFSGASTMKCRGIQNSSIKHEFILLNGYGLRGAGDPTAAGTVVDG